MLRNFHQTKFQVFSRSFVILLIVTMLANESLIILDLLHIQVLSITCKNTMYVSQLKVIGAVIKALLSPSNSVT